MYSTDSNEGTSDAVQTIETILTIPTIIAIALGLLLSCISLAFLFLTAVLIEEWKKTCKNQLLINLTISRLCYTLTRYISDLTEVFNLLETQNYIGFKTVFYFYTDLSLVASMYMFSQHMYDSLVTVVYSPKPGFMFRTVLLTWIIPIPLSIFTNYLFYCEQQKDMFSIIFYTFLIKWPMLIANAVLLIIILISLLRNKHSERRHFKIVVVMFMLIVTFCIQLIIIDVYKIVCLFVLSKHNEVLQSLYFAVVLANLLAVYQCPLSIFFWLFGNGKTRKLWLSKICKKNSINISGSRDQLP